MLSDILINNIRKLMNDRNLTQAAIASYMDTSESQFSKILSGSVQLSLKQVSNLASGLSMREIDLITYPDIYVKDDGQGRPVEATLQIRLSPAKREKVLSLILGKQGYDIIEKEL